MYEFLLELFVFFGLSVNETYTLLFWLILVD